MVGRRLGDKKRVPKALYRFVGQDEIERGWDLSSNDAADTTRVS